jgi:hypothetical protein
VQAHGNSKAGLQVPPEYLQMNLQPETQVRRSESGSTCSDLLAGEIKNFVKAGPAGAAGQVT